MGTYTEVSVTRLSTDDDFPMTIGRTEDGRNAISFSSHEAMEVGDEVVELNMLDVTDVPIHCFSTMTAKTKVLLVRILRHPPAHPLSNPVFSMKPAAPANSRGSGVAASDFEEDALPGSVQSTVTVKSAAVAMGDVTIPSALNLSDAFQTKLQIESKGKKKLRRRSQLLDTRMLSISAPSNFTHMQHMTDGEARNAMPVSKQNEVDSSSAKSSSPLSKLLRRRTPSQSTSTDKFAKLTRRQSQLLSKRSLVIGLPSDFQHKQHVSANDVHTVGPGDGFPSAVPLAAAAVSEAWNGSSNNAASNNSESKSDLETTLAELEMAAAKEARMRAGLEAMLKQYTANPAFGDASSIVPELDAGRAREAALNDKIASVKTAIAALGPIITSQGNNVAEPGGGKVPSPERQHAKQRDGLVDMNRRLQEQLTELESHEDGSGNHRTTPPRASFNAALLEAEAVSIASEICRTSTSSSAKIVPRAEAASPDTDGDNSGCEANDYSLAGPRVDQEATSVASALTRQQLKMKKKLSAGPLIGAGGLKGVNRADIAATIDVPVLAAAGVGYENTDIGKDETPPAGVANTSTTDKKTNNGSMSNLLASTQEKAKILLEEAQASLIAEEARQKDFMGRLDSPQNAASTTLTDGDVRSLETTDKSQLFEAQAGLVEELERQAILSPSRGALMIAIAKYSPESMSAYDNCEDELAFEEGQILEVFGDVGDDGYYVSELAGRRGLAPADFLDYASNHKVRASATSAAIKEEGIREIKAGLNDEFGGKQVLCVQFDYDPGTMSPFGNAEDELKLTRGQKVTVYGPPGEDGYYVGEADDKRGLVPADALGDVDAPAEDPKPVRLRAMYPYAGRKPSELSFSKGDEFDLVERTSDEWLKVSSRGGHIGFVPATYVKEGKKKKKKSTSDSTSVV